MTPAEVIRNSFDGKPDLVQKERFYFLVRGEIK